jgi:hypothetical protein
MCPFYDVSWSYSWVFYLLQIVQRFWNLCGFQKFFCSSLFQYMPTIHVLFYSMRTAWCHHLFLMGLSALRLRNDWQYLVVLILTSSQGQSLEFPSDLRKIRVLNNCKKRNSNYFAGFQSSNFAAIIFLNFQFFFIWILQFPFISNHPYRCRHQNFGLPSPY